MLTIACTCYCCHCQSFDCTCVEGKDISYPVSTCAAHGHSA